MTDIVMLLRENADLDAAEHVPHEVVQMQYEAANEIERLREQVERLTEAYDQCGRTVQDYGRTIDQTESRLREVATHCANVEQQLAALAEQNEKLRETLTEAKSMVGHPDNIAVIDTTLSLPNLATPALNRIRAEGMRMAAQFIEDKYDFLGEEITVADEIRARADELEQSK